MKKTILLLSFITFAYSMFAQKTLSLEPREVPDKVSIDAKKDEAEVRIYSSLPLTFLSITKAKDNNTNVFKVEKEGPINVYYFLFSSLSTFNDRKLRISSKGYKSIEIPLELTAYTISAYAVRDEEKEGCKGLVNDGNRLYEEGLYDHAKIKYLDAMERLCTENNDMEDVIIAYLDKVDACVIAKERADKLYNDKKWMEAKKEYEQVTTVNPTDRFCKERIAACIKEYENTPRIIKGVVTDKNGNVLSGVTIAPWEEDDKGKKKMGLRTYSDNTGAYQVKTINKTTELIYMINSGAGQTSLKITGDIMNFVAEDKTIILFR